MTDRGARDGAPPHGTLQGLERAFAVMEQLTEKPMRAKEIADALGMKWATAHRTLTALRESGCLIRDEDTGAYQIGPRLYYLGSAYLGSLPMVAAARSELRAAAAETGTTAQLVTRYRDRSMNLIVSESGRDPVPRSTINFHFPLHCGSKGHVLLAFAGQEFIDAYLARPLEALTRHTITDPAALADVLELVRRRDYAVTKGDIQLSTGSVAAPVRDSHGNVVASITLIAHYSEIDAVKAELIDVALRSAAAISIQLGWRPGVTADSRAIS